MRYSRSWASRSRFQQERSTSQQLCVCDIEQGEEHTKLNLIHFLIFFSTLPFETGSDTVGESSSCRFVNSLERLVSDQTARPSTKGIYKKTEQRVGISGGDGQLRFDTQASTSNLLDVLKSDGF